MVILSGDSKKLLDCIGVVVKKRMDYADRGSIFCYDVKGIIANGREELISKFDSEEKARQFVELLSIDLGANRRAKEYYNEPTTESNRAN